MGCGVGFFGVVGVGGVGVGGGFWLVVFVFLGFVVCLCLVCFVFLAVCFLFVRGLLFFFFGVSIEGQQASPSKGQAKRLRELDKENKLSPDVIDGILCEEKKKEDRDVIITGAELEKFFGKEATPRQMKDQIMTLLEDWKERQPPELAKPDKKMDMEK